MKEYILTTSVTEEYRLKRQHDLWLYDTIEIWKEAKINQSHQILELGAGPGFSTLDLARYLGQEANVTAIELAENFAKICQNRLAEYKNVKVICDDLLKMNLPENHFDAIYGRWIFMFLPNLDQLIAKLVKSIRPGGKIIIQEYVDYDSMALYPINDDFQIIIKKIIKSFNDSGGNASVMQILPQLIEKNKMKINYFAPKSKIVRPIDPFWDWPTQFYASYLPTMATNGIITEEEKNHFLIHWQNAKNNPGIFWIGPTMGHLIAEKAS